ncbi:4Fe-4S dicluster domain-containing protein [Desulfobacterales bacterium HSG16]|nr:4Fe-4S dicluster domain-containing protein [Desulfobacterales bacterium HSG16]
MEAVEVYNHDREFKYTVNAFCGNQALSCFACSTCSVECPVNEYFGKLDPRKIVQMAAFGMDAELLTAPEIWLCLNCKKCSNVCPQNVSPSRAIMFLQNRAIERKIVGPAFPGLMADIDGFIQNIRHSLYQWLIKVKQKDEALNLKERITDKAFTDNLAKEFETDIFFKQKIPKKLADTNFSHCMVCRECTSTCVVARHIPEFDPAAFVRMHLLGMKKELAECAQVWLCIGCETCTSVCRQGVKVQELIKTLKKNTITEGGQPYSVIDDVEEIERYVHMLRSQMILQTIKENNMAESVDLVQLMKSVCDREEFSPTVEVHPGSNDA